MNTVDVKDSNPSLAIKNAILVRSGVYTYSRDEVEAWGLKPKANKSFYRVYRPAGTIIDAKDKFNMVPVTKDHPVTDVNADNFHTFASGVTGGPIEAVTLEDGEIALKGKVAFFTREAFDQYNSGNKETSAGIEKVMHEVEEADRLGYDYVLKEIKSVNHMAIVPQGRGGIHVRVMDSAVNKERMGGTGMSTKVRGGILRKLGIIKAKDENFKFSETVISSVSKVVNSLDSACIEKEITEVLGHISSFGESETKEVLVGLVTDCYKNPAEVIAAKDKVAVKLDELYVACRDADSKVIQNILDAATVKTGDEDDGEDGGDAEAKVKAKDNAPDIEKIVETAMQKVVVSVTDSIESKIDAIVAEKLGLSKEKKPVETITGSTVNATDSNVSREDASFLVRGIFGN